MGRKELHFLASSTTICGNPVEPQWFSAPLRPAHYKKTTHGDEKIGLGLFEINPDDLADSVGIGGSSESFR